MSNVATEYAKLSKIQAKIEKLRAQLVDAEKQEYNQIQQLRKARSKATLSVNSVQEALEEVNKIVGGKLVKGKNPRIVVKNASENLKGQVESQTNIGINIKPILTSSYKDVKGYEIFLLQETRNKLS